MQNDYQTYVVYYLPNLDSDYKAVVKIGFNSRQEAKDYIKVRQGSFNNELRVTTHENAFN